ncbi:adenine nucleotide alpha hydrolases-like protein [Backusella circina FSU 941]|nr:adenine nucleotide alpha hydrolases-like protein [Backusella circina FSU 941]
MTRKVLIGYDHSEISNKAMEWIVKKKAILPDDNITVITIVNDDAIAVEGTFGLESTLVGPAAWMADDYRERVSQIEKDSTDALKSVVTWFNSKGFNVTPKVLGGDPGETLKDFAEANHIDLVIVGSRGLGFIKRQFLGSVSEYLTHHLKCSVLVVKDEH